jgi:predicted pyridoxine 5'-phosphate oxidase superfamily flavin-nucleotide-binding protein
VPPAGVADPALLDLEFADDQQVRPSRTVWPTPVPVTSAAAAGSPADGPTRPLRPVGPAPAPANPPYAPRRPAQPQLQQPVQPSRLQPGPRPVIHPQPPQTHYGGRPPPEPDLIGRPAVQPGEQITVPSMQPGRPAPEPGSAGEHLLQCAYGTAERAQRFYRDQVLDHLNAAMIEFVGRMELAFISTADAGGECDASLRAGPPGFLHVLDDRRVAYPEYRGNGVLASLGNISENPHIGLLLVDFVEDLIGLHVNGRARIVEDGDLRAESPELPADVERGRTPERWVVVHVDEAYVHCRKHIPRMQVVPRTRDWGTDDAPRKGGDFFGVRARLRATTR